MPTFDPTKNPGLTAGWSIKPKSTSENKTSTPDAANLKSNRWADRLEEDDTLPPIPASWKR